MLVGPKDPGNVHYTQFQSALLSDPGAFLDAEDIVKVSHHIRRHRGSTLHNFPLRSSPLKSRIIQAW